MNEINLNKPTSTPKVDRGEPAIKEQIEKLGADLGALAIGELNKMIDGGVESIRGPVLAIGKNLAAAAQRGDQALIDECKDQLQIEIDKAKLRALKGRDTVVNYFLTNGLPLIANVAAAGLGSLKR